ncbi:MAG: glucose 1-dehydrogenase [Luminiphilus sp.]|nr:glucose 1-dehydrogenase [Luminiphilus sp.]
MERRLEGQVAVITGGASGIGAATAEKLIAHGAKVVLGDIQEDRLAGFVTGLGADAIGCRCDVTKEDDVRGLVETAMDSYGRIDVMFNNAGIVGAIGPMETTPTEEWKFTLDILLNGVFYGMKHASKHMKLARRGSIVSMSSTAGVMGGLGPHAYAAAKHAVVGLTKNLAAEVCSFGVRVNCLAPGLIATPLAAAAVTGDPDGIDEAMSAFIDQSPLTGRAGMPEDVANAVLWLASDEAGYINGQTIAIDAGLTTGSKPGDPNFAEYQPILREAGKSGF